MNELLELDPLTQLPEPLVIQRRLGQIERERVILNRLLPLALAARKEIQVRAEDLADCAKPLPENHEPETSCLEP